LHEYLGGTVRGLGGVAQCVGGVEDHVHLLVGLKTMDAPADVVRELKKASCSWAQEFERGFKWQEGYAIFSVSSSHRPALVKYIATQEEHHAQIPFVEELKRLLARNHVEYDPRYLE
jgi:hypothetical protein